MNNERSEHERVFGPVVFGILWLISIPFWAGAIVLAIFAMWRPEVGNIISRAQHWESAIFAFGLGIGLTATAVALGTSTRRLRACGLAGVLMGTACVTLAYIMHWSIDRSDRYVALPFAIPSALAFTALVLFLNALITQDRPQEKEEEDVTLEPQ